MKNINYIQRQEEKTYHAEKGQKISINELLEKEYTYINDSIKENNYMVRLNECDQFKELIFNQKVVGFVTYNKLNKSTLLLTNIYILPGYRRSRLFTEEIKKQYKQSNKINIYQPNKLIIDVLIKLGYAKQINKTLLVSAINFTLQLKTALNNNNEETPEKLKTTNLYDTNICATLSFKIFTKDKYTVYYTQIQEEDKNKCQTARKNMEKNYFNNIVNTIINSDMEIQRWLYLLRHNLPQKQTNLDEIIGTEDNPKGILKEKLEEEQINTKQIKKIQNQIKLELKTNTIDRESVHIRLHYLTEQTHNKKAAQIKDDNYCPYCYEEKPSLEHYCTTCGYKFFDITNINDEEYVYKYLLEQRQRYKNTITGKQELKNTVDEKYRKILAMCDIIKLANEYALSYEIFLDKSREYGIPFIDLEELMIRKNYVTFSMNPQKWELEAPEYTNSELKEILKEYKCKVSGNKYELIQRIKNEIPLDEIQSNILEPTDEGINYYNDKLILRQFHIFLKDYIYTEFKEFLGDTKYADEKLIYEMIKFLQKHIDMAHETRNHDQLINALITQSQLYTNLQEFNKFLENEIKIIIYNLNMYYLEPQYYAYYKPVSNLSWKVLYDYKDIFTDEEINDTILDVYNSFEKNTLKVTLYDMIDVFKDIFKHYSYTGLNGWIQRKYYKQSYNRIHDANIKKANKITTLDKFF